MTQWCQNTKEWPLHAVQLLLYGKIQNLRLQQICASRKKPQRRVFSRPLFVWIFYFNFKALLFLFSFILIRAHKTIKHFNADPSPLIMVQTSE